MSERAERYYTDRADEFADVWQGPIPEIFKKIQISKNKQLSIFYKIPKNL